MDKIQDSGSCDRRSIRLGGTKGIGESVPFLVFKRIAKKFGTTYDR